MNFTLTPDAVAYINQAQKQMGRVEPYLRIGIKGQGCCSPMYALHFTDTKQDNDGVFPYEGFSVVIDNKLEKELNNAEMTTVKIGIETRLKINNPNFAKCSCHSQPSSQEEK